MLHGSNDAKILFITDFQRVTEFAENKVLSDTRMGIVQGAMNRAGIPETEYAFLLLHPTMPKGGKDVYKIFSEERTSQLQQAKQAINNHKAQIIVPMGQYAFDFVCSMNSSIFKQHCSILQTTAEFGGRKCIPMLHPEYVERDYPMNVYISFCALRLKEELTNPVPVPERKMLISLDMEPDEVISYIEHSVLNAQELAIDVETGRGIINTVGFAISPLEAIAVKSEPYGMTPQAYHYLWSLINKAWSSDIPKIAQNAVFEFQWASKYGIRLNNITFDTMWAMRFLHPELEKGLANVGRLYTRFPYWKDDHSDWNNIRDWRRHLTYNCADTTGTFQAKINQAKAIEQRGLSELFYNHIMKLMPLSLEMCSRGLKINEEGLLFMRKESEEAIRRTEDEFNRKCVERVGHEVNTRSPKQVKEMLKAFGVNVPTKKNKAGENKETADKKALVQLRKKYPDVSVINDLLELSKLNKELSGYLGFKYDADKRARFTLDLVSTETMRGASYLDPFGNGFNAQTVPKKVRKIFVADDGKILIQIDLQQAESRFVAFDAPEPKLMQMLENGEDVHKYVASRIFKKLEAMINKTERQLGKKSGHSANYGVGPKTFAEAALVEMGIVLSISEAARIINGYYETFPGVRKRQKRIEQTVRGKRMIKTPAGFERIFYGRMNDQTFREAYAYEPQSTIPYITNRLALFLYDTFPELEFLVQVHDSLLLQCDIGREQEIIAAARDYEAWHPDIQLAGGKLIIPIDAEIGFSWGRLENA